MSVKFEIKNTASVAEKEGDSFLRFSGTGEYFNRVSERYVRKIGVDGAGNPKFRYNTGLDIDKVQFLPWYTKDEQKEVIKQIEELTPTISAAFGGPDVIEVSNQYFWRDDRTVSRLQLNSNNINLFYDTEKPSHALLYLSIISGAFIDLVAPTRDYAERNQIAHFLQLETDEYVEEDNSITKSDAHAALSEIRKDESQDALFILAWCLQYDTNAYGAYLRSTPIRDLIAYHIQYIEGKLSLKKKKNTPKVFIEYVEKWKGQQTRPLLYVEAYVKAGDYYNFLQQKNKKFTAENDVILGSTVEEAVTTLMKPKFSKDLEKLRGQVENKWKE